MTGNRTMQSSQHRPAGIDLDAAPGAASPHLMIPSPFIVQLAASHAGIGPYGAGGRDGLAVAAKCYRAAELGARRWR